VLKRRDNTDPQRTYPAYRPPQPAAAIDALPVVDTPEDLPAPLALRA